MSAIGAPSLDYKRFLSDAGSGLVALVSLAIVTHICGTNGGCNFGFVTTLYEYFIQIFPLLVKSVGISGVIIILSIILFTSLMLGFIVNALSYLLLDDLINQIVDNVCFQRALNILGSISYYDIKKFQGRFNSIDYHFSTKNLLSDCKNKKYAKCMGAIKTRVSIERPDSFRNWGEVEGGRIMFRNFIFIILFCLFFIFLSFWNAYDSSSRFFLILIIIPFVIQLVLKLPDSDGLYSLQKMSEESTIVRIGKLWLNIFKYISLTFMTPLLIAFLPVVHDPYSLYGLSTLGFGTIMISMISLNILFFLSVFALTYYHYHIFIAAMYASLGNKWH